MLTVALSNLIDMSISINPLLRHPKGVTAATQTGRITPWSLETRQLRFQRKVYDPGYHKMVENDITATTHRQISVIYLI